MPSRSGGGDGEMPLDADKDGEMLLQGGGGAIPLRRCTEAEGSQQKLQCEATARRRGERRCESVVYGKMVGNLRRRFGELE
jgi:hypothetical protein